MWGWSMLPEKRRRGRAIRKRQRAVVRIIVAFGEVAKMLQALGEALLKAVNTFLEFVRPLIVPFLTYQRQHAYWLARSRAAAELSEAYTGDRRDDDDVATVHH